MTIPELLEFAKENHVTIECGYDDTVHAYEFMLTDSMVSAVNAIRCKYIITEKELQIAKDSSEYLDIIINDTLNKIKLNKIKEAKKYEIFN